jgi:hypothetical protein
VPATAAGNVEERICNLADATTMVMPSDAFWDRAALSWTVAVKLDFPLAVGAPEITPAGESARPIGRLPDVTDHVYEGTPPVACKDCVYAWPKIAEGSEEATIVKAGAATEMVIAVDFVWFGFSASFRVTLKEKFPDALGVPEITPVVAAKVSPEGSALDDTFQE